ncbi:D-lactonohydrolase-like protein [Ephemerocybe angulata]|uniref:D-lactonohydrolase-like protein n=1 Tax=Ephemerocybe angulata TaxID=980116 RepID=A0A8H6I9W5_9AGAR|nr:D-lactonohydrolase-like protein [Tulosesus angulatus]
MFKRHRRIPRAEKSLSSLVMQPLGILSFVCAACLACTVQGDANLFRRQTNSQVVLVEPSTFAVTSNFRNTSSQLFNPTSTAAPFFQVFDRSFLDLLGPNPSLTEIASNSATFAHEAPVYVPATDEVFFASNNGNIGANQNNRVAKISMRAVETAIASGAGPKNVAVEQLTLSEDIQMTNGGTGPYQGSLVLATSGRGTRPPSIALVNPKAPYNSTVLLNNYFGRQFNSLNDVKIHPTSGTIFFTDVTYGNVNGFRPTPVIPNQVYRLDPNTRAVRVAATDFSMCNGIAFTADGKIAYVSDTGSTAGATRPSTIYAFDVDTKTQSFVNRRVFAYADTGIPDGVQVDAQGNVYSGTGEGVQVWNDQGTLIGKFFIGTGSANMVFAGDGRLVILAETKIFLAKIAAKAPAWVAYPQ